MQCPKHAILEGNLSARTGGHSARWGGCPAALALKNGALARTIGGTPGPAELPLDAEPAPRTDPTS
jgi:hypothetical protein